MQRRRDVLVRRGARLFLRVSHVSQEIEAEQLAFILGIFADDVSLGDLSALDELGQTHQLSKLAFEIEVVAFAGDQVNIAFAAVEHSQKRRNIDIVQFNHGGH